MHCWQILFGASTSGLSPKKATLALCKEVVTALKSQMATLKKDALLLAAAAAEKQHENESSGSQAADVGTSDSHLIPPHGPEIVFLRAHV